jgi:hypothetical protein
LEAALELPLVDRYAKLTGREQLLVHRAAFRDMLPDVVLRLDGVLGSTTLPRCARRELLTSVN